MYDFEEQLTYLVRQRLRPATTMDQTARDALLVTKAERKEFNIRRKFHGTAMKKVLGCPDVYRAGDVWIRAKSLTLAWLDGSRNKGELVPFPAYLPDWFVWLPELLVSTLVCPTCKRGHLTREGLVPILSSTAMETIHLLTLVGTVRKMLLG